MNRNLDPDPLPEGITAEGVRKQLSRMLASPWLAHSPRVSQLLRFLVDQELAGRGSQLTDYEVGRKVFERPASFDPRLDSIVRVHVNRLRSRVARFYESDGRDDTLRIEFVRGDYRPRFTRLDVLASRFSGGQASTKILVVEDERIVAADLAATLEAMGFEVVVTHTGEQALAIAKLSAPDMVLMDIALPGSVDGIDAARAFQQDMGIPVVFATAHSNPDTLERATGILPAGYVLKPFRSMDLRVAVQLALVRRRTVAAETAAR